MENCVTVLSRADAAWRWSEFDSVITIEDSTEPAGLRLPDDAGIRQLVLKFDDVVSDGGGRCRATDLQIARALEWARSRPEARLLVHCEMGVSRSAAVALGIIAERSGHGCEAEAVDKLLAVRPMAAPNPHIVATLDALLGRKGRLEEAVRVADERRFSGRFFIPA